MGYQVWLYNYNKRACMTKHITIYLLYFGHVGYMTNYMATILIAVEGGRKEDPRGGNVVVEESEVEGTVQGTGLPLDGGVEEEDEEDMSDHLSHHSGRSTQSNRSASQKKGPIGGGGDSPSAGRKQRTGKSTQKHRKVIQSCLTLIKHLSQLSK